MNSIDLFYTSIELQGKIVYCQFQFIYTAGGGKYFITALAPDGTTGSFEMKQKENGRWQLVHPAPQWITTAEKCLQKTNVQHTQSLSSIT